MDQTRKILSFKILQLITYNFYPFKEFVAEFGQNNTPLLFYKIFVSLITTYLVYLYGRKNQKLLKIAIECLY